MRKELDEVFTEEELKSFVTTGFVQMDNLLFREIILNCKASGMVIYQTILSHRNTNSGKCFPTYELIAKETGYKSDSVKKKVYELADKGYLIFNSGSHSQANDYYFPLQDFYDGEGEKAVRRKFKKVKNKDKETPTEDNDIDSSIGECFEEEIVEVSEEDFTYDDLTFAQKGLVDVGLATIEQYKPNTYSNWKYL